jgi:hypothetical protein
MIVGIISENAILPIYSLKRHLLVRMIKAIASLCNLNAFKTELMTALGHYCIITFSDWNRYGFRVASTFSNCGNRGFNSHAFTFNSTTEFVVLF